MIIPKLRKERTVKIHHGHELTDDYAFVDQANILQILKKPDLILPEVRKYIESNNELTEAYFADVKDFQKKLFSEIKGKIKLSDEGLKYKDRNYFYWNSSSRTINITFNSLRNAFQKYHIEISRKYK